MIIGYKDFLYNENTLDDTIEMSIQFSMHIDQEEWYVASWLQKRDYAIVRIYSDSRAKRLDWYRYRLTNHIKDDEIIEEQHFHVYSDIRPDLQLLKRVCEMFAREKYIIQKGIVPDITYEKKWWLLGTFEVAERKVVMWVGTQTNPNTLIIKALSRTDLNGNKFTNMAILGDDGSLDIDPNEFKIHALVGGSDGGIFPGGNWSFNIEKVLIGIGFPNHAMYNISSTYETDTSIPSDILQPNGSVDLITNSLKDVFNLCKNLTSIPIINNMSNCINMSSAFHSCESLISLDVSGYDTSNVTNMNFTFTDCSSLESLDVSNWDTSKVTRMRNMFYLCTKLKSLDVSNWDTSNVTDMYQMFNECNSLESLDTSNWNTSNVTDMNNMFNICKSLKSLNTTNWNTGKVTDMNSMFKNCEKLTSLDVSNWDTSNVTDMNDMFCFCKSLTSLDVSNWDTSKVTNISGIFGSCESLTSLDVSNWDTSKITNMGNSNMIYTSVFPCCHNLKEIKGLQNWNTSNVTGMNFLFYECYKLETIDVSTWDTSKVTCMWNTFYNCYKLKSLNTTNWNTGKVTNMNGMFKNCEKLTSLDVSNWDTSNVTNMRYMFERCRSLKTLDVSNWDTSNVTDMGNMFWKCSSLESLDVSNWDTSKVTDMSDYSSYYASYTWYGMFNGCSKLKTLNISNWDTSNVEYMNGMFANCTNLESIIGVIDLRSCTHYENMFYGCSKLTGVKLKNVPSNFSSVANISSSKYTIVS